MMELFIDDLLFWSEKLSDRLKKEEKAADRAAKEKR